jgi:hypothetical protein
MRSAPARLALAPLLLLLVLLAACEQKVPLTRALSSFQVKLLSKTGSSDKRCLLAATPTAGVDLSGCPDYIKDASGTTVIKVEFQATAMDNKGGVLDTYDNLATVKVVPGNVDPAFQAVRFSQGKAGFDIPSTVVFRGAFDDTFLWVVDDAPASRDADSPGVGASCGVDQPKVCSKVGLTCVNATRQSAFDPEGLIYCSRGCNRETPCAGGYTCSNAFSVEGADQGADVSSGACLRIQPSYAAGVSEPIHLAQPTITDVRRSDTIIGTPFDGEFVEVKHGKMVVTAIRIDGFYVTDVAGSEFNSVYVYNYSRPEDLYVGDLLNSVSGPVSDFNGYTEINFPLWDVNVPAGMQPDVAAIDLHGYVKDLYPALISHGGQCFSNARDVSMIPLLDCNYALKRLEAARVSIKVSGTVAILPGSKEETNLNKYGQWPVNVDTGSQTLQMFLITRDNIPFFDPRKVAPGASLGTVSGNLRVVAFDEMSEPEWIVEPRDQADCMACVN